MPEDIVISVPKSDTHFLSLLENQPGLNVIKLAGAGMDGGGDYLVVLIPLTHFAVKTLVDLLRNPRKTVAVSAAPPEEPRSSSTVWRRASATFALLKAHWESAKHVSVEVDGMSFKGAPLSEISKFLERYQPKRGSE